MFHSWQQDLIEKHEFVKDYSVFIGSFTNLKMAQKILGKDSSTSFENTEFDDMNSEASLENDKPSIATGKRRRRRK